MYSSKFSKGDLVGLIKPTGTLTVTNVLGDNVEVVDSMGYMYLIPDVKLVKGLDSAINPFKQTPKPDGYKEVYFGK